MSSSRPDLNLVPALHVFLEERHVSRAAAVLGISQPAASVMLRRLRHHFADELLLRVGNGYELTPLALALQRQTGSVLELSERLFATRFEFEPATTEREFTIAMSDYAAIVLGPALLDAMATQAPGARLHLRPLRITTRSDEELTLRSVDGLVMPRGALTKTYPHRVLFEDEWVGVTSSTGESDPVALTVDDLRRVDLIVAHDDPLIGNPVIQQLEGRGVSIRYRASVDSFLALPYLVGGSGRFAIVQKRLVGSLGSTGRLSVVALPVDLGVVTEAFWWHPAHANDPGHSWFRQLVLDAGNAADRRLMHGAALDS